MLLCPIHALIFTILITQIKLTVGKVGVFLCVVVILIDDREGHSSIIALPVPVSPKEYA